ncbi:hypothetical protein [Planococcus halotolerans]|uniref:Uncharacterized protein n=1 Tax=Planococcus halotolerans TaxID=2233542 RepID=A0A365KR08_9BACL|nr:hypothetical protein [Planococcus halotolerans]QHJ69585.1 hypothetical protein DNR44_002600 [Planococcus halotolerans]RAZ75534.1 hypothetical protein DP120_14310 [Planococcus halotolerans]
MDDRMYKEFLESQLQWSKNQTAILDKMESKLLEMKKVAEYAAGNVLSSVELENSTAQINKLNQEYQRLTESYQLGAN